MGYAAQILLVYGQEFWKGILGRELHQYIAHKYQYSLPFVTLTMAHQQFLVQKFYCS
jgi:hypothetical protein